MVPLKVDALFREMPEIFAYQPPAPRERAEARIGDMVKVFLQLKKYVRPRPIWVIISAIQEQGQATAFRGKAWETYGKEKREQIGMVEFDSSHIYRLPLNRPEVENPVFDVEFRDQKRIAE